MTADVYAHAILTIRAAGQPIDASRLAAVVTVAGGNPDPALVQRFVELATPEKIEEAIKMSSVAVAVEEPAAGDAGLTPATDTPEPAKKGDEESVGVGLEQLFGG